MNETKKSLNILDDVCPLQKKFKFASQSSGKWTQIIEFFARVLTDDCSGVAILGQGSFEQIWIKSINIYPGRKWVS